MSKVLSKIGPVVIALIAPTNNENWMRVSLEQSVEATYTGEGSNKGFRIQNMLGQSAPMKYEQMRFTSEIVTKDVVEKLVIGQEIEGHIKWSKHSEAQYEGHGVSKDGSFITSEFVTSFEEDSDLRIAKESIETPRVQATTETEVKAEAPKAERKARVRATASVEDKLEEKDEAISQSAYITSGEEF